MPTADDVLERYRHPFSSTIAELITERLKITEEQATNPLYGAAFLQAAIGFLYGLDMSPADNVAVLHGLIQDEVKLHEMHSLVTELTPPTQDDPAPIVLPEDGRIH